jgi:predicted phosphoribosyltransferase
VGAVPVAARAAAAALVAMADEMVCLWRPAPFVAVGRYYEDFTPTGDAEAAALLERAVRRTPVVEADAVSPDRR